MREAFDAARENTRRRRACPQHRFEDEEFSIGVPLTCTVCGGTLRLSEIGEYAQGFKAAGGDPADIWPALGSEWPSSEGL